MMKKYKKIGLTLYGCGLMFINGYGQAPPTTTSPAALNGNNSNQYWSRAGNQNFGGNNIFGTLAGFNSPIYTVTNGVTRTRLNGNLNTNIANTGAQARNGYLGIGTAIIGGNNFWDANSPFSQLHLVGRNGNFIQDVGYRNWMQAGLTFSDNQDLGYIGLRQVGGTLDATEFGATWADNNGQDDFVFRFTAGQTTPNIEADFVSNNDLDGLHIARFTGLGLLGLGNTFGLNIGVPAGITYNTPRSLMHMSYQYRTGIANEPYGFMQITYCRPSGALADIIGQGEQATDGLRFGIDNDQFSSGAQQHLNSYLRWQEASSFIIQTEDNNTPNIQANERMRVTSIGALGLNYTGLIYNGLTANTNATRVSISESGSNPLVFPKSLLHIGYDYGAIGGAGIQGYRRWMDLGVLTSNNRDHIWMGLKRRQGFNTPTTTTVGATDDNLDAVVAWGTDRTAANATQVDNMRFIFTGHPFDANPEQAPSIDEDGLEMMRMYPATQYNHFVYNNTGAIIDTIYGYGRVGVGDFTPAGVNEQPTEKLDVVGNGRFRYLPDSLYIADSLVNKIVMVDSMGVLRWKTFIPSEFGTNCADSINGKLDEDKKVVLNNHNLYFTNHPDSLNFAENKIGLGYGCGAPLPGKLSVWQLHDTTTLQNTIAGHFLNTDINASTNFYNFIGNYGEASGLQTTSKGFNTGGEFYAKNAPLNRGVVGTAEKIVGTPPAEGSINTGGSFYGIRGATSATGVFASGVNANLRNYGVNAEAVSNSVLSTIENVGGSFRAFNSSNNNYGVRAISFGGNISYGIFANGTGGATNRAGFFAGPVEATGFITTPSDQQFKTNVTTISDGLKVLTALRPVSYFMDTVNYDQFNFGSEKQFGFIAQEVALNFPNLVHNSVFPAEYDSLGNVVTPAVSYKSLNYNNIIPLNTQAIIELNQKVDRASLSDQTIKTNVQDLNGSLSKVLQMRGVSFEWDQTVRPEWNMDSLNHVGFIAQEIAQIDNRLTFMADDSLLHVEYDKVVPILAEAITELNTRIDSIPLIAIQNQNDSLLQLIQTLQAENTTQQASINDLNNRLSNLENCLAGILPLLCQLSQNAIQNNSPEQQELVRAQLAVTLSNKEAIILDQNVPNPFAEQTVINFSIPATVQKAQIHFYNLEGRIIQSVDVVDRGAGSLTVFGADLSSGTYTYTLVADGQIVATKKMMKQ